MTTLNSCLGGGDTNRKKGHKAHQVRVQLVSECKIEHVTTFQSRAEHLANSTNIESHAELLFLKKKPRNSIVPQLTPIS